KDSREFAQGILNGVLSLNADEEHDFNDLASWNERVRRELGTNAVIAVGYDDGGGRILLGVAGEHRGEVWLQLHDKRPGDRTRACCGTTGVTCVRSLLASSSSCRD